jgi:alanine-glyoxylate transaminase / serine-glyoxylate transaminase / serine-pyruvate transaminase
VRKRLLEKYDIDIAVGFGQLLGKIFRIGLMGPLATPDNVELLSGALIDCLR